MHQAAGAQTAGLRRKRLEVTGQVQGVGFRPFVYRRAQALGLAGFVSNTPTGARIEIEGTPEQLARFLRELSDHLPPLARIDGLQMTDVEAAGSGTFTIDESHAAGTVSAEVTVDTAICDDCLREMLDPANRRHRYPFINCTNCGPRYTIVTHVPYDRPNTTMAGFTMCPACRAEYDDPGNRRFHAQPIACPVCGPRLVLLDKAGRPIDGDPIRRAAAMLAQGQILAIKGLGGFHLAADAASEQAVQRLRCLKARDQKPFALMLPCVAAAERICILDESSRLLLEDITRPIVISPQRPGHGIAPGVSPGLDTFGIMLPYAPHHYLLFAEGLGPLVMTSGNPADEPIIKDNDEAFTVLGPIADAFLMHDRPIYRRVDDSVLQARNGDLLMIRRARGFVPSSIPLGMETPRPILAVGGELKNTVALATGTRAILSEHLGDLKDPAVYDHFQRAIHHLCGLFDIAPEVIACDLHPEYLSSQYANERLDLDLIQVQHHHAHVVSCMVENGLSGPVVGISADGTGLGTDNAVWGGEILIADRAGFTRAGHLDYFGLPGGDAAAKQTFRPALGVLVQAFGEDVLDLPAAAAVCPDTQTRKMIVQMIGRNINCPVTSSLGRLFDAVAALLGAASANYYEGQAPMLLEALADSTVGEAYPFELHDANGIAIIDVRPMIRRIVDDLAQSTPAAAIAGRFHATVAAAFTEAGRVVADKAGIRDIVLSGGCFANRRLSDEVSRRLTAMGLTCYRHRRVPCNDGGLALGQAAVAAARLANGGS